MRSAGLAQGTEGIRSVLGPCMFVFLGIMYREILMDINDWQGDREAGIWTLPVVVGRKSALATATAFFSLATCAALYVAWCGSGLAWMVSIFGGSMQSNSGTCLRCD
jgi:4-hydroxybenzoate polyprenyltransferase